jgi:hypothetical protein
MKTTKLKMLLEGKKIKVTTYGNKQSIYTDEDIQEFLDDMDTYWNADNLPKWLYSAYLKTKNRNFPKNKKQTEELLRKILKSSKDVSINVDSKGSTPSIKIG